MAGNENQIETLKLDIDVNVSGQEKLEQFEKSLKNLESTLKSILPAMDTFIKKYKQMTGGLGGKSPEITVPTIPTPTTPTPDVTPNVQTPVDVKPIVDGANEASKALDDVGRSADGAKTKTKQFAVLSGKEISSKLLTSLQKVSKSLIRVATYRAFRTVLKNISEGFREGVQNLARYSDRFNGTMSELTTSSLYLKNALGTIAQPILELLIPAFTAVVDVMVKFINAINEVRAIATGATSFTKAKGNFVDYRKSMEKTGKTAKKLQRDLMGFDEINKLTDKSSSGAGDMDYSNMFETQPVNTSDDVVAKMRAAIDQLATTIAAALVVIGAILVFTGASVPLGLGMIIAGATVLAATVDWKSFGKKIEVTLEAIFKILGFFSLVIGMILVLTAANIPLGIGLIIMGATLLAGAVLLNWSMVSQKVEKICKYLALILAGAALVIGIILCFTGAGLPLGIALIILGAAALAAQAALNWDLVKDKIKSIFEKIKALFPYFLLAIGVIIAFTGVGIPLGIALMFLGAKELAKESPIDWDVLVNKAKEALSNLLAASKEKLNNLREMFTNWKAKLKMPHIQWVSDGFQTSGWVKKALEVLNLPTKLPKIQVSWYAQGGFPEDGLFMANHGELVGKFANGRTAVANNEQITTGIEEAAYRGFMRAMSGGGGGTTTFIAQLNGKTLFEEVITQNKNATKTYGTSPLTAL